MSVDQLSLLPDPRVRRVSDPATSQGPSPRTISVKCALVLETFRLHSEGLTDDELRHEMAGMLWAHGSYSKRRHDLTVPESDGGFVGGPYLRAAMADGRPVTRLSDCGQPSQVWELIR